jgi:hypothetical protein
MMSDIIMKLRRSRHTAPIFGDRVTGVAEASRAFDYQALTFPAAFVCYLSDQAEPQEPFTTDNKQRCTQRWGVIVALQATEDIRGQDPTQQIDDVRQEIFGAIYNWSPRKPYSNLWYDSTKLLAINRAVTFWLLTFGTYHYVCDDDGELEEQFEPLPDFYGVNALIDWKKPHDPGLPPSEEYDPRRGPAPWPTGPEGRIETAVRIDVEQPPPGAPRNGKPN